MKIYSNNNNTCTLKLLIAAGLANRKVELQTVSFTDNVFTGPHFLPQLKVDENVSFFSSNAAAGYLFSLHNPVININCQQMLEWEATRLRPAVQAMLSAKSVASDLKQLLVSLLKDLETLLVKNKFVVDNILSVADISIWSTLYPLYYNKDYKMQYVNSSTNILRWMEQLGSTTVVQEAVTQWGGSCDGPFTASSSLGIPQVSSLLSPVRSPDDGNVAESGPTDEECQLAKDNWQHGRSKLQEPIVQGKEVLPVKGYRNILITSALPYVNNIPHLGNIIGCVLSADIFARYCRVCNYNTLYVCGTDEYGTATETKALEEGLTPRQICDKYFAIHNDVYRWFNIGFDYFGRTSTPEQTEITQKMFLKLKENGFISTQSVDQLLCQKCDRFLADRFVEGTCHHPGCLYGDARGDQCDKCGKLVNATELIDPRCKICGEKPVLRASEQLFLDLAQLEPALRSWASGSEAGWSGVARAVARGWLRDGLRARAITRDLKWGVSVPHHPNKVFYVWFDAPMGYMSITQCATKNYEKWWKPDKEYNVKLYQFMAKDNVPFHAVMFPATLIGVNESHLLVDHIYATEYLNYEEGKFSKSRGVGVFGTDAQDTGISSDVWRFYLASIRPETSDSSFIWENLGTSNNSELLNNIGNFLHRSLSFCYNTFKGVVPDVIPKAADYELMALVNREVIAYVQQMEKGRLREALRHVLAVSRLGNQHMQSEQPWVLLKGTDDDKERGSTAIGLCCQISALLCTLLSPYTPETSRKLSHQLNLDKTALRLNPENPSLIQYLPKGHVINKPEPLFTKIEPERLEELRKKYAGTQSDRDIKSASETKSVGSNIAELEAAIANQGEIVRKIKASTKDKALWQTELNKLLSLKMRLLEEQSPPPAPAQAAAAAPEDSVSKLEKAITRQGEVVRKLKASTKDKAVWQPEVNKLLDLKKQLANAQAQASPVASADDTVHSLEKAIAEQGEVVRTLKASAKDKKVWQPELNKLLTLKKQLANAQAQAPPVASASDTVESLEKAIADQGQKVRNLKASTKDKAVWQPEVNVLLDLKKKLATLQVRR